MIEWDIIANQCANSATLIKVEGLRQLIIKYLSAYDYALIVELQFLT